MKSGASGNGRKQAGRLRVADHGGNRGDPLPPARGARRGARRLHPALARIDPDRVGVALAGRKLSVDEAVCRWERRTGHRNRAIALLELAGGMIEGGVDPHLDLYVRQCAIAVMARDLAVMADTLANGGVNPTTGVRAVRPDFVRHVLSVMTSCGMHDYAGEWEFEVGRPAKSGVGVFSPRRDGHGNSVRGVGVRRELSARLKRHMLDHRGAAGGGDARARPAGRQCRDQRGRGRRWRLLLGLGNRSRR